MKSKKGFTLVEVIACTVILAMVTIGTVSISARIQIMKSDSRGATYLSLHNLNVMEELREKLYSLPAGEELPAHFEEDVFSSPSILTNVIIDTETWYNYKIYNVTITSRMRQTRQVLRSSYTLTNIGAPKTAPAFDEEEEEYETI